MINETQGHLLRIYVGEADRHDGKPLYQWIIHRAREMGLAGATALRGLAGFGASSRIHSATILRLSEDLPVVIEIVDRKEKLREFLKVIDSTVDEGLATIEQVQIHFYRSSSDGVGNKDA